MSLTSPEEMGRRRRLPGTVVVRPKAFVDLIASLDIGFKAFGPRSRTAQRLAHGTSTVRVIVAAKLTRVLEAHGASPDQIEAVFPGLASPDIGGGDEKATLKAPSNVPVEPSSTPLTKAVGAFDAVDLISTFDRASHPYWIGDSTGTIRFINRAMARFLGLTGDERMALVGKGSGVAMASVAIALAPLQLRDELMRRQAGFAKWLFSGGSVARSIPATAVQETVQLADPFSRPTIEFAAGRPVPRQTESEVNALYVHCDVDLDSNGKLLHSITRFDEMPSRSWSGILTGCPSPKPDWWFDGLRHLALIDEKRPSTEDSVFVELVRLRDVLLNALTTS